MSPNQTIAVKMTHKSQSAPTETSLNGRGQSRHNTHTGEDGPRAGLIGGSERAKHHKGLKNVKKNNNNNDVSFRSQHADVASTESKSYLVLSVSSSV